MNEQGQVSKDQLRSLETHDKNGHNIYTKSTKSLGTVRFFCVKCNEQQNTRLIGASFKVGVNEGAFLPVFIERSIAGACQAGNDHFYFMSDPSRTASGESLVNVRSLAE